MRLSSYTYWDRMKVACCLKAVSLYLLSKSAKMREGILYRMLRFIGGLYVTYQFRTIT